MKVVTTITIDHELLERFKALKKYALSTTINTLIEEFLAKEENPYIGMSKEELAQQRALLELREAFKQKEAEILNGRTNETQTS